MFGLPSHESASGYDISIWLEDPTTMPKAMEIARVFILLYEWEVKKGVACLLKLVFAGFISRQLGYAPK